MTAGPHTVLVVDDEFASLEVLALLLIGEGFLVLTASNGDEALTRLAEQPVELVITDYKMPKMDGSELCERMLSDPRYQSIPVIFTSATYRQDIPRPSNVRAFFSKPLLFKNLLTAVHQILAQQNPG
ncbi:MAG TPA: response regulator [Polyangiaceae bacterium]|jgi:CheY-like chemotaxis protein|nr:response regulator [Polyangiaceae bacterium]